MYDIVRIDPFKGKHFKVTRDGAGVSLCKTYASAVRRRDQLVAADHAAAMTCTRCGQSSITRQTPNVCQTCKAAEHRKQGETVRLFEPAPNQIPGQLTF